MMRLILVLCWLVILCGCGAGFLWGGIDRVLWVRVIVMGWMRGVGVMGFLIMKWGKF